MRLCRKILAISFKEKSIFRFDYIVGTVFAFLYIVLKVYLVERFIWNWRESHRRYYVKQHDCLQYHRWIYRGNYQNDSHEGFKRQCAGRNHFCQYAASDRAEKVYVYTVGDTQSFPYVVWDAAFGGGRYVCI